MTDSTATEIYVGNTGIISVFSDEKKLITQPLSKQFPWSFGNGKHIDGIRNVLLYENNTLEAALIDQPSAYYVENERGFWTQGTIKQDQLATYINAAANATNQLETPDKTLQITANYLTELYERLSTNPLHEFSQELPFETRVPDYVFAPRWNPDVIEN